MRDLTDALAHLLHHFDSGVPEMPPAAEQVYRHKAEVVMAWAAEHRNEIPFPSSGDE